jgi:hypothetical protein
METITGEMCIAINIFCKTAETTYLILFFQKSFILDHTSQVLLKKTNTHLELGWVGLLIGYHMPSW